MFEPATLTPAGERARAVLIARKLGLVTVDMRDEPQLARLATLLAGDALDAATRQRLRDELARVLAETGAGR